VNNDVLVGENPIEKRMIVVSGDHGEVCIDIIDEEFRLNERGDGEVGNLGGGAIQNQLIGLQLSVMSLWQENLE